MQTHTPATLTVRPFRAGDYADIPRLHNLNFAEFSPTEDEFRFDDSSRVEPCKLARWVAECDGRIVGYAHYEQAPHIYHPRKFQLHIAVDPDFFGRGIGGRLYAQVLGEVPKFNPLTVDEGTRADSARRGG